jgi:hypothetical protein
VYSPAQRFDAETITGTEGSAPLAIPNDKSKHPVQPLDYAGAPVLITLEDDLCIRTGSKCRSLTHEQLAQFKEIVNFPIEDNNIAPIAAVHRLITGREVDN